MTRRAKRQPPPAPESTLTVMARAYRVALDAIDLERAYCIERQRSLDDQEHALRDLLVHVERALPVARERP